MSRLKKWLDWNILEILFFVFGATIEIVFSIIYSAKWYEILYTLTYFITALLMAKGKYVCYIIGIVSIVFYCITSYFQNYYGEMFIALFMTLPLMILGLISWKKHNDRNKNFVIIQKVKKSEMVILLGSQLCFAFGYYLILKALNNNNLIFSTLSIVISFIASYLSVRRDSTCFLVFIINDIILICLWGTPIFLNDFSIIPVFICPCLLMFNDIYGYINWKKTMKEQT